MPPRTVQVSRPPRPEGSLWKGPGGWWLAPEGAAVHLRKQVAVVADVHLGYEWARGSGGDLLPAHSLAETITTLSKLFERAEIRTLIVAGDLVESSTTCRRTARDVARLAAWLEKQGVAWSLLQGNHDPPQRPALPSTFDLAGWTVSHGHHRPCFARRIIGHYHPVVRTSGVSAPCFLVGSTTIVLPALSPNASGLNVLGSMIPPELRREPLRCLASTGDELLDFGTL